jgi:hypothetical protein
MKQLSILLPFLFLAFFNANSSPLSGADLLFKSNNQGLKNRLSGNLTPAFAMMRMNMYALNSDGTLILVDGTLTQYDDDFSNSVNGMDARKLTNPGENIGMIRDDKTLIIESRQTISLTDTIFFKMWRMQKRSYQMQFVGTNLDHPGLQGFLEDTYLKSSTSINLNDTTKVTFAVNNDTASASICRFRLVFKTATQPALPFVFTSVDGYRNHNYNIVKWKTRNEMNLGKYIVERSVVGKYFFDAVPVNVYNSSTGNYQWVDENPVPGHNYYRVGSVDTGGKIEYSKIIEVYVEKSGQNITVYPNPATVDNFNLRLNNQEAGLYEIQLVNTFGQTLITMKFNYIGGSGKQKINLGKSIPKRIYQLQIKTPAGGKQLISVVF